MTKTDALKLKAGDTLRYKPNGKVATVKKVVPEQTDDYQHGTFPLVITKEFGPVTYRLLRFEVKAK